MRFDSLRQGVDAKLVVRHTTLPMLLIALGIVAFANAQQGAFVFDDLRTIVNHPSLPQLWPDGAWTTGARRPLGHWSFHFNYRLGGLQPLGYHVVNLAIHIVAALFLFGSAHRLLARSIGSQQQGFSPRMIAFAISAIWLIHPLQTESVTYIVQRLESQMGMLVLGAIYAFIRGRTSERRVIWWSLSVVLCYAAMLTKETAVVTPILIVAIERCYYSVKFRESARRVGWIVSLMFVPGFLWLLTRSWSALFWGSSKSVGFHLDSVSPGEYLLTQAGVVLHYLRLSVWPSSLCIDYGWPVATGSGKDIVLAMLAGLLLIASIGVAKSKPKIGFILVAFFVTLAPTSSFIPIKDLAFEHRMYLPLISIATLFALGIDLGFRRLHSHVPHAKQISYVAFAILLVGLTVRTVHRNADYRGPKQLWTSCVEVRPENYRAHHNLAVCLVDDQELSVAEKHLRRAVLLNPNSLESRLLLGEVLLKQGDVNSARDVYQAALEVAPTSHDFRYNYALCLLQSGDQNQAISQLHLILEQNPSHDLTCNQLGLLSFHAGEFEQAERYFREAVDAHRQCASYRANHALSLERLGDLELAYQRYGEALYLDEGFGLAHHNLGWMLVNRGSLEEAIRHFELAIESEPENIGYRRSRAQALARIGSAAQSIAAYEEILRRWPDRVESHVDLATALQSAGQVESGTVVLTSAGRRFWSSSTELEAIGITLSRLGESELAIGMLERCVELEPDTARCLMNLGAAHLNARNFEKAKLAFESALSIDPEYQPAIAGLARANSK